MNQQTTDEDASAEVKATTSTGARDRTGLWLPLLRRLSETFPDWATWKNVESALAGTGDVDSLAPPARWREIQDVFADWAREHDMGPVISCPHVLMGPHLITFEPGADYIVQLDVKERATFRGSTLIDVRRLKPLTVMDERGFRRVRTGADGVIRLCSNAIRPGGTVDPDALRIKRIPELLRSDPEGVEAMAASFGPARRALLDGVDALLAGGWDVRAMRRVERWALMRSVAEPWTVARRIWFARVWKQRCPVVRIVRENARRVPKDPEAWLHDVKRNHEVIETRSSAR